MFRVVQHMLLPSFLLPGRPAHPFEAFPCLLWSLKAAKWVFLRTWLAPYVEFGWEILPGPKTECLLPTNSLQFGTSLKRWGKELLNWIRRRQTEMGKGTSVARGAAVAGSNLRQYCCRRGMSDLPNWTYLKTRAAFRLNIFSPKQTDGLQQPSPSLLVLLCKWLKLAAVMACCPLKGLKM